MPYAEPQYRKLLNAKIEAYIAYIENSKNKYTQAKVT